MVIESTAVSSRDVNDETAVQSPTREQLETSYVWSDDELFKDESFINKATQESPQLRGDSLGPKDTVSNNNKELLQEAIAAFENCSDDDDMLLLQCVGKSNSGIESRSCAAPNDSSTAAMFKYCSSQVNLLSDSAAVSSYPVPEMDEAKCDGSTLMSNDSLVLDNELLEVLEKCESSTSKLVSFSVWVI